MRGEITNAELHSRVDLRLLPDGEYAGIWKGNLVHVRIGSTNYWMQSKQPFNGQCYATVRVDGGKVAVESGREQMQG